MPRYAAAIGILAASLVACASRAAEPMPWAFNAPRAAGYSIDLVSAEPAPGTPLKVGTSVAFTVKLRYALQAAPRGTIILVFQDDQDRNAAPGVPRQVAAVHDPAGELTMTQTIVVPQKAKELRLFIPIVPEGVEDTTGEVTLRYPIEK